MNLFTLSSVTVHVGTIKFLKKGEKYDSLEPLFLHVWRFCFMCII